MATLPSKYEKTGPATGSVHGDARRRPAGTYRPKEKVLLHPMTTYAAIRGFLLFGQSASHWVRRSETLPSRGVEDRLRIGLPPHVDVQELEQKNNNNGGGIGVKGGLHPRSKQGVSTKSQPLRPQRRPVELQRRSNASEAESTAEGRRD